MKPWIPILSLVMLLLVGVLAYLDMHHPDAPRKPASAARQQHRGPTPAEIIDRELNLRPTRPAPSQNASTPIQKANTPDANALERIEAQSEKSGADSGRQRELFVAFTKLLNQVAPLNRPIYLNTPISSILDTPAERERFKELMRRRLHYTPAQIEQAMRRNRLVWDWVHTLREE